MKKIIQPMAVSDAGPVLPKVVPKNKALKKAKMMPRVKGVPPTSAWA